MAGTGVFAEPTFQALLARPESVVALFTQPDRVMGQQRGSTRQTGQGMAAIARAHGVPVCQPENINTPYGQELLAGFEPDLLVVAAYGQILKDFILAIPRLGCINVHASLLPKYRGAAPIAWAIYHGETQTGISIIRMTPGLDAGAILAQQATDIGPEETTGQVETRLAKLGAELTVSVVNRLLAGEDIPGLPQDPSQVSRAPKLTKEHGAIDWSRRADQICCHVRAMQPWPTAYTYWHRPGQPPLRLIVCLARSRPRADNEPTVPGIILPRTDLLGVVAGADTVVEVLELQPAGKRRLSAAEFLRGRRPQPGDRLGPEVL
jgi:methionyl-tRNA formyltransferase